MATADIAGSESAEKSKEGCHKEGNSDRDRATEGSAQRDNGDTLKGDTSLGLTRCMEG